MRGRYLLVTDLDGTLLGNDEALRQFAEWYQAQREQLRLVYNSGRLFQSTVDLINSTALPEPDAVIGGVSTEVRYYPDGDDVLLGWPTFLGHWDIDDIQAILAEYDELQLQPPEFQTPLKLSFYAYDLAADFLARLQRRLATADYRVNVVYSSGRDLDVMPTGVSKGSAIVHLACKWKLRSWQVIVSGVTGSNLSMFLRGFRGIVPANAHKELKGLRSPHIYHSEHSYAAGVLEGMEFWLKNAKQFTATRVGPMLESPGDKCRCCRARGDL